ncbi:MAG: lamin tail domain-containing protein [Planctomycetota bacterium]
MLRSAARAASVHLPLALAVGLSTAAADVTPADTFGSGCSGFSLVTPTLTTPTVVIEGDDFLVEIDAGANLFGELHFALQKDFWLGIDLPVNLTVFGAPGCILLVPPDVTIPIATDGDGNAVLSLPSFDAGTTVYLQALLFDFDPSDNDPLVALSAGVELGSVVPSGLDFGDLVVTEIMANPSFVSDASGEWIEVYNPGSEPLDLRGWCLTDDQGQRVVLSSDTPIEVPAQSFGVLGNNADPLTNGGVALLYDWSQNGSYSLSSPADTVRLVTPDGIVVDEVVYGGDSTWANPIGASLELAEGLLSADSNDDAAAWEVAACFIGGSGASFNTDTGTPGTPAGSCLFPSIPNGTGELIFNEVMQNPSQVSDLVGEWFEVLNTTSEAIDLAGYTIALGGGSFVVEGPLVVPAGGVQLFHRNGNPAENGGLPPGYDYPDLLFLPNGEQVLSIADPQGGLVCLLTYDNGNTYPDPNGASMSLDPAAADLAGAIDGTQWCEGTAAYGAGDLGTPGAPNPCCGC